jgi:hypothetical protein
MNLTVGPLPPAVYWRRRALVLGIVLVFVILFVAMCNNAGGDHKPARGLTSGSPGNSTPTPTPSVQSPIIGGTAPGTGGSAGTGGSGGAQADNPAGSGTGADAGGVPQCTDDEMQLTPSVQKITGGYAPYQLNLKIRNTSAHSCKRDVGAGPQELHMVDGTGQVLWSSDYCQSAAGSDVRTFGPNIEALFQIGWDGFGDGPGCVKGPQLAGGTYQIVAKLGGKVGAPVNFTIAAAGGGGGMGS